MLKKGLSSVVIIFLIMFFGVLSAEPLEPIPKSQIQGYIIQFQDEPVTIFAAEKENEIKSWEKNTKFFEGLKIVPGVGLLKDHIENLKETKVQKIKDYSKELQSKNEKTLEKIEKKISKEKEISKFKNVFNGVRLDISGEEAQQLKEDFSEVKEVYPVYPMYIDLYESVPLMGVPQVWTSVDSLGRTVKGEGVTIAVIDTGVDYTHTDLGGCFGPGCKVIGGWDLAYNDSDPMDDNGHGTHVAATAAGDGVLKGVAPGASVLAYKVCDSTGACAYALEGIEKAIDPNGDGDFSDKADILSMSIGGLGNPDDPTSQAADNAVGLGSVVVVAAGNSGPAGNLYCRRGEDPSGASYSICSPGTSRMAITVGASDKFDVLAGFSSRGPVSAPEGDLIKPDILAPGVSICAAQWDSAFLGKECVDYDHVAISGTSMATPHVSGLVALIKQAHPDWTPDEIKNKLQNTAIDLGYSLYQQGFGRVDAVASVDVLSDDSLIARIDSLGKSQGVVPISGFAGGYNFSNYSLYYGAGAFPSSWILLDSSSDSVNGTFYSWNTEVLTEGTYSVKVEVQGIDGTIRKDKTITIVDNYQGEINSPHGGLLGDPLIPIIGFANGVHFNHYNIYYSTSSLPNVWLSDRINLVNGGSVGVSAGTLGFFNTSGINVGQFNLKLEVYSDLGLEENVTYAGAFFVDKLILGGWPFEAQSEFGIKSVISDDLNFDGNAEVLVTSQNGIADYSKVYLLDGSGSVFSGWPKNTYTSACVSTGEFDGDSEREIVVTSSFYVHVYNMDGTEVSGWPIFYGEDYMIYVYYKPCPVVVDLNNDGRDEIVIPFSRILWISPEENLVQSQITILDHNANNYSGWPKIFPSLNDSWFYNSPTVGDIDKDGDNEIIFRGIWDNDSIYVLSSHGVIERTMGSGEMADPTDFGTASPQVVDFDRDGYLEIVDLYGKILRVHNYTGEVRSGFPLDLGPYGCGSFSSVSPAVVDINFDGYPELVFGCKYIYDKVLVVDRFGNVQSNIIGRGLGGYYIWPSDYPSPIVADFDGDVDPEVFYNSGGWTEVSLWNFDGANVSGWPRAYANPSITIGPTATPSVNDINGDGYLDFILGTTQGSVLVWNVSVPYNKSRIYWQNDLHDPQHTGLESFTAAAPPVEVHCSPGQIIGDANGDGIISIVDVSLIGNVSFGNIISPQNICCVDVDQNGIVGTSDILLAAQIVQGNAQSPGLCQYECIDVNDDGVTNFLDLSMTSFWQGKNKASPDWNFFKHLDYNFDEVINKGDIDEINYRYGEVCSAGSFSFWNVTSIYIYPSDFSINEGDTFFVDVLATALPNESDIYSVGFDVSYNPSLLSLISVSPGSVLNELGSVYTYFNYSNQSGIISSIYLVRNMTNQSSNPGIHFTDGNLVNLTFVSLDGGPGDINISNAFYGNSTITNQSIGIVKPLVSNASFVANITNNNLPNVSNLQCNIGGLYRNCSFLTYSGGLSKVKVYCRDSDGYVNNVTFRLYNLEDNSILFERTGIAIGGDSYEYIFVPTYTLRDSGYMNLTAFCSDSSGEIASNSTNWFVPYGNLSVTLNSPLGDLSIPPFQKFWVNSTVQCIGAECGNLSATLEPLGLFFGTPFFISGSNPDISCVNLKPYVNPSCSNFWYVTPADVSGSYGLYVNYSSFYSGVNSNQSNLVNVTISGNSTDTTPPIRSGVFPVGQNYPVGTINVTIGLNTNEPATCRYDNRSGISYPLMQNTFSLTGGFIHNNTLTGLSAGNNQRYYVKCQDAYGNNNTDDVNISFSISDLAGLCQDFDLDGYGVCPSCGLFNGCLHEGDDCNDTNTSIHPNAIETCTDNVDNDCDGSVDCLDSDCDLHPSCSFVTYYDLNYDGKINIIDLAIVIYNQGKDSGDSKYSHLDLDGSGGNINWDDVQAMITALKDN